MSYKFLEHSSHIYPEYYQETDRKARHAIRCDRVNCSEKPFRNGPFAVSQLRVSEFSRGETGMALQRRQSLFHGFINARKTQFRFEIGQGAQHKFAL